MGQPPRSDGGRHASPGAGRGQLVGAAETGADVRVNRRTTLLPVNPTCPGGAVGSEWIATCKQRSTGRPGVSVAPEVHPRRRMGGLDVGPAPADLPRRT